MNQSLRYKMNYYQSKVVYYLEDVMIRMMIVLNHRSIRFFKS